MTGPAQERVTRAFARIAEVDRPEVWITLRSEDDVLADAAAIDAALDGGAELPLAGLVIAVKDNIDVVGMPTTAGCPAFSYAPGSDAAVVARARAAGAVVIGKTNLDQFATGLVGTRSPYGAVRDAARPEYVSGGSSSGSAVAVALGIVDAALGTDTAGSGRVPAAFQRIVGLKPTRGLLSLHGVVPAARSLDCVSVFGPDLPATVAFSRFLTGAGPGDPYSRTWPADAPLGAPVNPKVGIASADQLPALSPEALSAYESWTKELERSGAILVQVDVSPLLSAARLLYGGSFVAARYAAVGAFIDAHRNDVDPTVASIISAARAVPAHDLVADEERVTALALHTRVMFAGIDALALPTTTSQPTIAEVAADPVATNARLGTFTNFCNLLDLCAVAVPAGSADGGGFGVTLFGPAFHDGVIADVAAMATGTPRTAGVESPGCEVAVFGAHLSGQPLNHQLSGGRLLGAVETEPGYQMYALATTPPKPGLVAVGTGGAAVSGELWALPPDGLARLLTGLSFPMALGPVRLAGRGEVVGFLCQPAAVTGARDITAYGSWPAHLATL